MLVKKIINNLNAQKQADRRAELYKNLIRHEAKIGGQLFGAIPKGGRREFFCLDEHTWVWHEEWIDKNGQRQIKTTRYDMRPDGVLKSQNGQYQAITNDEAKHLHQAISLYQQRVNSELYSFVLA